MEVRNCKFCEKEFNADLREIKRGHALFCSLSCFAKYRNKIRPLKSCKCITCGKEFLSKNTHAKYCSSKCKSLHYRQLIKTNTGLTRRYQTILLSFSCENCGWNQGPRDVHHIIPVSLGGRNELFNLITLCPNCHRLAHRNLLSKNKLLKLIEIRTIFSSSKEEMDALAGN